MFLINFLPDFIFYVIAMIGILGFVAAFFLPLYRNIVQAVCVLLTAFGFYYMGGISEQKEWEYKLAQAQLEIKVAESKAEQANKHLEENLAKNQMQIHATMKANLNRLNTLAEKLNNQCVVPQEVITLINNSARNIGSPK